MIITKKKIKHIFLFVVIHIHLIEFANCQVADSLKKHYTFLKIDSNKIINADNGLSHLKKKIENEEFQKRKIVVTHIGDSHIQADNFSGKMRKEFQLKFGNAGRGLVFPYQAAKTNGPPDYSFTSSVPCQSKRCIFINNPMPIGICGITLKTDTVLDLNFSLRAKWQDYYSFNSVKLIHENGSYQFEFSAMGKDSIIETFRKEMELNISDYTHVILDTLYSNFNVKGAFKKDSINSCQPLIFGAVLDNGKPGIQYNMIGVNGAEYRHYNAAATFYNQVEMLKTELFIISLGTNDAVPNSFNIKSFMNQVDSMVTLLKIKNPNADILLTSPGDFNRRKKYRNKNVSKISEAMYKYCLEKNVAYWNWYQVMGGQGSVLKLQKKNLAQKDRLHLTAKGYEVQGQLLFEALTNALK